MSTVRLPLDYYDRPEPPPRRRRSWKRIVAWTAAGLLVAAAGLLIGLAALLHNDGFRQYLLRTAQQRMSDALGAPLRMRDFSVHLSGLNPSVDMYDTVVEGAKPYPDPPLLRVDRLTVGIQITSVLQRKWDLSNVVMDHPVAHIFVGPNGETNLPKSRTSGLGQTSVFDLGVRHVKLSGGELYYNDRRSVLDADLHDLKLQASFDAAQKRYSGELSYHDGRIHVQDLDPVVHSLEAEFNATPDTFHLKQSTLTSGASQITLTATLHDYVNPRVEAAYRGLLDTGDLRRILNDTLLPIGVLRLEGSAQYQSDPGRPLLETLSLDGNMSSNALQVHTTTIHTQVRDISAKYRLAKGDMDVRDIQARLLGGELKGSLKIHDVTAAQESELHAVLHGVGLGGIQALMNPQSMKQLRVGGTANVNIDATWRKRFDMLAARTDANLKGTIAPAKGSTTTPVAGEIHANYSAAAKQVSFTHSYLSMPQTSLNLSGTVSERSSVEVQFQSNDLHEVETVATLFGAMPQPLDLHGAASFTGTVKGSTTDPQIDGQLSAASLKVKGTEWRTLETTLDLSPSHVNLRNGDLRPANDRGRIKFNMNLGLDQWAFKDTNPIQIEADASEVNVTDLRDLAGSKAPVTGTLSGTVSLHGSMLNPVGQGAINLTQATVADEPIQSANLTFEGTGDEIRVRIGLRMTAGTAQGTGAYFPRQERYDAQLQATGIRLDQFLALKKRNLQVAGVANLNAKGSGTLSDPGFHVKIDVPRLQVQNETINGVSVEATVSNNVADVALDSQAMGTFVRGHGKVNLTGAYYTEATMDTSPVSLQPVLATYFPAQSNNISGETELHATLRGPLNDPSLLDAHITIPTLSLAYMNKVQVAAASPIQMDYTRGVLTLQRTSIRGTGTDLTLQGTIPLTGGSPMALLALGTIDLRLAQMLDPDIASSGQIQFNINGLGQRANPNMQGQIKVVNAAFAGGGMPLGLQNANGVLNLTNDRLEIARFEGNVGSGTLTARGAITYRPSLQFNLSVAGNGIRLLYPQGVREDIDTNLTMTGSAQSAMLRGQVRLNELSFSPTFDLADIIGQADATSTAPPGGFARNLELDIGVQSTNDVNLASGKLSLEGAANLRVRGTAAEPVVLGRISMSGGDLIFNGNRYLLQPSTLDFINPYRIEPRVNAAVDTTVQGYNVHLRFIGPIDQLRTTYSSDPALPPSDIINLLVFGKTSEAAEANPTPGRLGAESLIASSVSSQVTSRIEKIAGISQLSIDPVLGGNQQSPGARVTIQQRVTANLFVTFATDPTSTQHDVVKLEYQATPRVLVSGVRDQNGGFALDLRIRKTW